MHIAYFSKINADLPTPGVNNYVLSNNAKYAAIHVHRNKKSSTAAPRWANFS